MIFGPGRHPTITEPRSKAPRPIRYKSIDFEFEGRSWKDDHLKFKYQYETGALTFQMLIYRLLSGMPKDAVERRIDATEDSHLSSAANTLGHSLSLTGITIRHDQLSAMTSRNDHADQNGRMALWPILPFKLYFVLVADSAVTSLSGEEVMVPKGAYEARTRQWHNLMGHVQNILIEEAYGKFEIEVNQVSLINLISSVGVLLAAEIQGYPAFIYSDSGFLDRVRANLDKEFTSNHKIITNDVIEFQAVNSLIESRAKSIESLFGALAKEFIIFKYFHKGSLFPNSQITRGAFANLVSDGYLTSDDLSAVDEFVFF